MTPDAPSFLAPAPLATERHVVGSACLKLCLATVLTGTIALSGCDVGPTYTRPSLDVPANYRAASATLPGTPADTNPWPAIDWWCGFGSPELDQLIAQAERENFDIAAAVARVRQADAQGKSVV